MNQSCFMGGCFGHCGLLPLLDAGVNAAFQRLSFPDNGNDTQNFKGSPPLVLAWCFLTMLGTPGNTIGPGAGLLSGWVRSVSLLLPAVVCSVLPKSRASFTKLLVSIASLGPTRATDSEDWLGKEVTSFTLLLLGYISLKTDFLGPRPGNSGVYERRPATSRLRVWSPLRARTSINQWMHR